MIQALVINVARYPDRLAFQGEQLLSLGIDYEVIQAVDKQGLSEDEYRCWAIDWERVMRPAEVACFLSHQIAWRRVKNTKKPWLILEDDALLSQSVTEVLFSIENKAESQELIVDMINLEARGRKKLIARKASALNARHVVRKLYQDRTGTAGYVLYPSGAKKLLDRVERRGAALADAFITSTYALKAYQVEPAPIVQLDQTRYYGIAGYEIPESTISTSDNKIDQALLSSLSGSVKRSRRYCGQLRMGLRFWRYPWLAERREIRVDAQDFDKN